MKKTIIWIVSIFFILLFLGSTPFSIANILFLISGLIILPPITKLLQSKIPKFTNKLKWIIFSISFIFGSILAPSTVPNENEIDVYNKDSEIVQIYQDTVDDIENTVKIYDDKLETKNEQKETNELASSNSEQIDYLENDAIDTTTVSNIQPNTNNSSNIIVSNEIKDNNTNNTISNTNNNIASNTNSTTVPEAVDKVPENITTNNQESITQTQTNQEVTEIPKPVTQETSQPVVAPTTPTNTTEQAVYITETGKKYHKSTCRHLKDSCASISLSDALSSGYTACKVCNP